METQKKTQQAFKLYQNRLQNLSEVINELHSIIKNDEIITNLKDPSLQKYRIDRINQIVLEILNSEKEKMLIRVLEKYQEMSNKLKEKENNGIITSKGNDVDCKQKYQSEILSLKLITKEKDQILKENNTEVQKLKDEIAIINNENKKKQCASCMKLKNTIIQLELEKKESNKQSQKLKKDNEQALTILKQKILQLKQQNQRRQEETKQKNNIIKSQQPQNQGNKRNQKIETMKRQIVFLQQELIQVERQFNVVKDLGLSLTVNEIKKLKKSYIKFKDECKQQLQNFKQQNRELLQKLISKLTKSKQVPQKQIIRAEKFMQKLSQLDNQLDYFIDNQLLVE